MYGTVAGSVVAVVLWLLEDELALDVWVLVCAGTVAVVLLRFASQNGSPIWYVLSLVTVVIVGESLIGADSGLGFFLGERLGLGARSANAQLLRRVVLTVVLTFPVIVLLPRVPYRFRRIAAAYVWYFLALFAAAVLVDFLVTETSRPVDDLLEAVVLASAASFSLGVALEIPTSRRPVRGATRPARRRGSRR